VALATLSSALLKLLHEEPESAALADWLTGQAGTPLLSSELANVEVIRVCRQINPDALPKLERCSPDCRSETISRPSSPTTTV
jgi:hypothetical protein